MAQQLINPDIICSFYSARMKLKIKILSGYLGFNMDLNTNSLPKFEDGGFGSAK
jgi:hypothetical protein